MFTFLLVKPATSNTQEALKNFEVDLIIIDVRIGTFRGIKKLNKSHFTLISGKVFTKGKVTGKLDLEIRELVLMMSGGENLIGNMN